MVVQSTALLKILHLTLDSFSSRSIIDLSQNSSDQGTVHGSYVNAWRNTKDIDQVSSVVDDHFDVVIHNDWEVKDYPINVSVEKVSSDVKNYLLFVPLEEVDRKEVLLVSKVLPEDGLLFTSVGIPVALSGTEIS